VTATGQRRRDAPRPLPVALLAAARPRQWVKNFLLLAAPLAAGVLTRPDVLVSLLVAGAAFCLASSGVYLVNDALDVEADRAHPRKRHRPVASGEISLAVAVATGGVLLVSALLLAAVLAGPGLVTTLLVYEALQVAYCVVLKHQAVLDLALVASGFLLRAVGGAVAAGVPPSQWFLLVAGFGSLFMVAGKRYAELVNDGGDGRTRRTLADYSPSYLRFVWGLAATVAVVAYALWAFEIGAARSTWATASIAPFVLAVLRYAVDVDAGLAGEPEDIVLRDRVLQSLAVLWLASLALAVHHR
jgi:decaprenyl-phosphate phosphoribosyltransferase